MQDHSPPIRAAIDIGSNTIHIVVARVYANMLDILADEEEMVRIGESVNASGSISPEKLVLSLSTLHSYQELARQHDAEEPLLVIATEAIRRASNSDEFVERVREETGLDVRLITGDAEATLTYYGATYEVLQGAEPPEQIGVVDLGGGSMELVAAYADTINLRTSVPIGSGWLHDRFLPDDPPSTDDLDVARTFLRTYFAGMPLKQIPPMLIATGGSANSLRYLYQNAFPAAESKNRLSIQELEQCEQVLRRFSAEEVAQRYQQSVKRTKVLPAGLLILQMLLERFQLSELHISPHGIREGALLASVRFGEQWLERVTSASEVAEEGSSETMITNTVKTTEENKDEAPEAARESFAQSGRRLALERLDKMLEWLPDVLKHEDIEAVHKMRVASRRLRAVLDAYEAIGNPRSFKTVYRKIKEIAAILGKARDIDVMIENLQQRLERANVEEQAGLLWLIRRLQECRLAHQEELEDFLEDLNEQKLRQQLKACLIDGGV